MNASNFTATPLPDGSASPGAEGGNLADAVAHTTVVANLAAALSVAVPLLIFCGINTVDYILALCGVPSRRRVRLACETLSTATLRPLQERNWAQRLCANYWLRYSSLPREARATVWRPENPSTLREGLGKALVDLGIAPAATLIESLHLAADEAMVSLFDKCAKSYGLTPEAWELHNMTDPFAHVVARYVCRHLTADATNAMLASLAATTWGAAPLPPALSASEWMRQKAAPPSSSIAVWMPQAPSVSTYLEAVVRGNTNGLPAIDALPDTGTTGGTHSCSVREWWKGISRNELDHILEVTRPVSAPDIIQAHVVRLGCTLPVDSWSDLRALVDRGSRHEFCALVERVGLRATGWDPYTYVCENFVTTDLSAADAQVMLTAANDSITQPTPVSPIGAWVRAQLASIGGAASAFSTSGGAAGGVVAVGPPPAAGVTVCLMLFGHLPKLPPQDRVLEALRHNDPTLLGIAPVDVDGAVLPWWQNLAQRLWENVHREIAELLRVRPPPLDALQKMAEFGWQPPHYMWQPLLEACVDMLNAPLLLALKLRISNATHWPPDILNAFFGRLLSMHDVFPGTCVNVASALREIAVAARAPFDWEKVVVIFFRAILMAYEGRSPPCLVADDGVWLEWIAVVTMNDDTWTDDDCVSIKFAWTNFFIEVDKCVRRSYVADSETLDGQAQRRLASQAVVRARVLYDLAASRKAEWKRDVQLTWPSTMNCFLGDQNPHLYHGGVFDELVQLVLYVAHWEGGRKLSATVLAWQPVFRALFQATGSNAGVVRARIQLWVDWAVRHMVVPLATATVAPVDATTAVATAAAAAVPIALAGGGAAAALLPMRIADTFIGKAADQAAEFDADRFLTCAGGTGTRSHNEAKTLLLDGIRDILNTPLGPTAVVV